MDAGKDIGCNTGDVPKLLEAVLPPAHPIFQF